MAPGAHPRPGRVPEQRLPSLEIRRWWRRSCGTLLEILSVPLGFSIGRLLIGEGASSGGNQGGLTIGGRGQGLGRCPLLCGQPLAPLQLSFGPRPSSGKIRLLELVLSNSENISCVAFLKHKNSRKQGTGTMASC
jgi:hypothetical protein